MKYPCTGCRKDITPTKNNRYRSHTDGDGEPCKMSSDEIPEHVISNGPVDGKTPADVPVAGVDYQTCPNCDRKVKLTRLGYFEPHETTLRGGERCPVSGVRAIHARKVQDVPLPDKADRQPPSAPSTDAPSESTASNAIPAASVESEDTWEANESVPDAGSTASTPTSSPESVTTTEPSPKPGTGPSRPEVFSLGTRLSDRFLQPASPFLQPAEWKPAPMVFLQPPKYNGPVKAEPMSQRGQEIAARLREIFYAYSNRNTKDNRSAQKTLGPSQIGTPCDRRLAMELMGVEPVNPGGDGWAAFVGTCGHDGLDKMFTWASASTGRFVTEMKLQFGSTLVPKGTGDLLDRTMMLFGDHKFMGDWSLKKLRLEGPSQTYRIQVHTYAYGAILAGEKVKDVAIIGWPRAGSSLDDLYVWTEKYDKKIAVAALKRVEVIAANVQPGDGIQEARAFATADDCKFCPFFLPKDTGFTRGCPGK